MSPDIRVVKNWIDENVEEIGCCQDIADHFGVKLETLRRRLVRYEGVTMYRQITRLKLERAMELLRSKKLQCSEVAYRTKLGSPSHAARAFKRGCGVTMTECRKQHGMEVVSRAIPKMATFSSCVSPIHGLLSDSREFRRLSSLFLPEPFF